MIIDNILTLLSGVKRTGTDRYICCCPAHDDKHPSMTIKQDGDKVLIHCFGGCSVPEIVDSIGLKMSDLFPERISKSLKPSERFNPYDVLSCLSKNLLVIELAVNDLAMLGAHFTPKDYQLVSTSAANIKEALSTLRGR